jgi:opacity protein-like surface antigen
MNRKCVEGPSCFARWVVAVAMLASVGARSAHGQEASGLTPQFDVSGSYSFLRANAANSGGGFNVNGGSASFAFNFSDRLAVVADGGAYRFGGLPAGLSSNLYTYLAGPRILLRKIGPFTPFAQVLAGGARLTANSGGLGAGENAFSMAVGGGLDFPLRGHLTVRVIQGEYLLTRFNNVNGASATQNNVRVSAGVVFRFGTL